MEKTAAKVSKLFVYPVKSCRGVEVDSLFFDKTGPRHDRQYMLVDDRGCFVTQRQFAKLATVHIAISEDGIELRGKGYAPVKVAADQQTGTAFTGRVWNENVELIEASEEASSWFSNYIGTSLQLVRLAEPMGRERNKVPHPEPFHVNFPDSAPALLINQASVTDLAEQVGMTIPFTRFRPNILIEGVPAWQEDGWQQVRVGGVTFAFAYPCVRCQVITIDQETADKSKEPLKTLASFRGKDPLTFGIRMIHHGSGAIRAGDSVLI